MFEGGRNDIEKAIELLKTINQNMKVDHMTKDMWDGATEEETREYIENFGLINIAISALEKQIPKKPCEVVDESGWEDWACPECRALIEGGSVMLHCWSCSQKLDWSVEE